MVLIHLILPLQFSLRLVFPRTCGHTVYPLNMLTNSWSQWHWVLLGGSRTVLVWTPPAPTSLYCPAHAREIPFLGEGRNIQCIQG